MQSFQWCSNGSYQGKDYQKIAMQWHLMLEARNYWNGFHGWWFQIELGTVFSFHLARSLILIRGNNIRPAAGRGVQGHLLGGLGAEPGPRPRHLRARRRLGHRAQVRTKTVCLDNCSMLTCSMFHFCTLPHYLTEIPRQSQLNFR